MSTVKIQGNVSGTGSITIAAPNTNSDLTMSLPAAGGTIASFASLTNNGVAYVNGSGQPTSGSALTFDGTYLSLTNALRFYNSGSGNYGFVRNIGTSGSNRMQLVANGPVIEVDDSYSAIFLNSSGGENARFTSTGLGIGTSSPAYKLDVQTAAGRFQVRDLGGSSLKLMNSTTGGNIGIDSAGGITLIYANGTETARFDSAGNLGLGVTPSAWSVGKAFEMRNAGNGLFTNGAGEMLVTANTYYDGAWRYGTTGAYAAQYICGNTNGTHIWKVASSSGTAGTAISFTQAMTLDASGNLGVGTSSPQTVLHVQGAANEIMRLQSSDATTGSVWFGYYDSTGNRKAYCGFGSGASDQFQIWSEENDAMVFATNNAERARIDSSGRLLVGTTSAVNGTHTIYKDAASTNSLVVVNSSGSIPFGIQSRYSGTDPNNTTSSYFEAYNGSSSALRFEVRSNGGIANYQANNVNLSDRREKTNFAPAKSYLETICAIPVQTFNYIDQNMEEDPGLTLGVVAQDVQAVAPELVMESNWGTEENPKMRLSIYQTDLQYALMKCIQELKAQVDAQAAEIAALKGTV